MIPLRRYRHMLRLCPSSLVDRVGGCFVRTHWIEIVIRGLSE
jgi:hypothetical protein